MSQVIVYKGRRTTITVNLGIDISADAITSEIRSEAETDSELLMTWDVSFATDGTDGELIFTVDDLVTAQIVAESGYMDIKRVSAGEALPVFDRALEVVFRGTVTE